MVRVCQCKCGKHARNYYTRADYYLDRQELAGRWGGSAIGKLGLREGDEVARQPFDLLCENRHPLTGERLTVRMKDNRTPGYDINFHVSKSVSILYALTQDSDILAAFRWAVDQTMHAMEARMRTRVRIGGQCSDRLTGNMGWAVFIHLTARPVEGIPDPHLHAHCFCFNAVFDPEEQRWKAGQFREIKQQAPRYQALFRQLLAARLGELGYGIAWRGEDFEIAGIDRALIDKFSLRHHLIEAEAQRRGILSDALKDQLGAQTREPKRPDLSMAELRRLWWQRLSDEEREQVARAELRKRRPWPGDERRRHDRDGDDRRHPLNGRADDLHDQLWQRQRLAAHERSRDDHERWRRASGQRTAPAWSRRARPALPLAGRQRLAPPPVPSPQQRSNGYAR